MDELALRDVAVNDLFHAEAPNGASLICRVLDVDPNYIYAKTVTTHWHLVFSRVDGRSRFDEDGIVSVIDSVASLPKEVETTIRGLEEKYRPGSDAEDLRLTDAEKKALFFIYDFYKENPI